MPTHDLKFHRNELKSSELSDHTTNATESEGSFSEGGPVFQTYTIGYHKGKVLSRLTTILFKNWRTDPGNRTAEPPRNLGI